MQALKTRAIVLSRTNYGEADRIITLITPEMGKLRLMARAVRALKSKLAGGIELFSINDISYIRGRNDLGTLVSARLDSHFGKILTDIDRVQFGYDMLKIINKVTEDQTEPDYFDLLEDTFIGLNDLSVSLSVNKLWFLSHLLALSGHTPNLSTDKSGNALALDSKFDFDISSMSFYDREKGTYSPEQIKFLRLTFAASNPKVVSRVIKADDLASSVVNLISLLHEHQLS